MSEASGHNRRTDTDVRLTELLYGGPSMTWTDAHGQRHLTGGYRQYSYDLNACREAELLLAERGFIRDYLDALSAAVGWGPRVVSQGPWGKWSQVTTDLEVVWALHTAPPDVRARVMVGVLEAAAERSEG